MARDTDLKRFLDAQHWDYATALSKIKRGIKQSHWMWNIFPQVQGLGYSQTSKFYAIQDLDEAEAFLKHPLLGDRLVAICNELLKLKSKDANKYLAARTI